MKEVVKAIGTGFGMLIGFAIGMWALNTVEDIELKLKKKKDE